LGPLFFMTEFYFMIRHTPFWAIPLIIIAGEFAYIFWLRKKKKSARACLIIMILPMLALSWYYYAGGPDKAVRKFMKWQRSVEL
jgi:hypothetical protein